MAQASVLLPQRPLFMVSREWQKRKNEGPFPDQQISLHVPKHSRNKGAPEVAKTIFGVPTMHHHQARLRWSIRFEAKREPTKRMNHRPRHSNKAGQIQSRENAGKASIPLSNIHSTSYASSQLATHRQYEHGRAFHPLQLVSGIPGTTSSLYGRVEANLMPFASTLLHYCELSLASNSYHSHLTRSNQDRQFVLSASICLATEI